MCDVYDTRNMTSRELKPFVRGVPKHERALMYYLCTLRRKELIYAPNVIDDFSLKRISIIKKVMVDLASLNESNSPDTRRDHVK